MSWCSKILHASVSLQRTMLYLIMKPSTFLSFSMAPPQHNFKTDEIPFQESALLNSRSVMCCFHPAESTSCKCTWLGLLSLIETGTSSTTISMSVEHMPQHFIDCCGYLQHASMWSGERRDHCDGRMESLKLQSSSISSNKTYHEQCACSAHDFQ